jgi:hypothetical protein
VHVRLCGLPAICRLGRQGMLWCACHEVHELSQQRLKALARMQRCKGEWFRCPSR